MSACDAWNEQTAAVTIEDLQLDALRASMESKSSSVGVEEQAKLALACIRDGTAGCVATDVAPVLTSWQDNLRIQGRTAYIASGTGKQSPAGTTANAWALLAILESSDSATFPVPNLIANYLGGSLSSAQGFSTSYGSEQATLALLALAAYDMFTASTTPDLAIDITNGETALVQDVIFDQPTDSLELLFSDVAVESAALSPAPAAAAAGVVASTGSDVVPFDTIEQAEGLQFAAVGSGEVTVAVLYEFIPADVFSFPQYRGLSINVVVQKADAGLDGPEGPPLSAVPISSVVVITVEITSPDDVGAVTVQLPMPAGLEPIEPSIAPDLPQLCDFPFFFGGSFSDSWWYQCPEITAVP